MMISRSGTHALKAMAALGALPDGSYAGASRLASRIRAPGNYLGKLLRQLERAGLVESRKGHGGGFRLARAMESIMLLEVLEPVEHITHARACILGKAQCSNRDPCALHSRWSEVREGYLLFLRTTSLKEAASVAT